jgi:acyl carrier protein
MVSSEEQSGVEARVLSVVTEVLAIEGEPPALDSSLIEDLGADSLDLLSLFMALEDEFGGTISEEDTEGLATLRDIVECISGRLGGNAVASQS